jgi:galactose mutarotase-like enzyme
VAVVTAEVVERRFRGEPALELRAGELWATFVPGVGMTGVSLRLRGREHLALPSGIDGLRAGHTGGLPLLAPWANRLPSRRYRAAGVEVDLRRLRLHTDANGSPMHGLLVGWPGWEVTRTGARGDVARVRATTDVDAPAFPFPHRLELAIAAHEDRLDVSTTVTPTGRRRVPVAFGWHPYLRVPGTPRSRWRLRLPAREHLPLDARGIPTDAASRERADDAPLGSRTFDDLYALGRDHRLGLVGDDGASVEVRGDAAYSYAQVWVPAGRPFAALEPMTVPTGALSRGDVPVVAPGEAFTARFSLRVS